MGEIVKLPDNLRDLGLTEVKIGNELFIKVQSVLLLTLSALLIATAIFFVKLSNANSTRLRPR